MAAPRLCVVGSSNVDLTFGAPRLPRPGETVAGHGFRIGQGGKGANQAVMAARLGARVALVSRVGRDDFGERTLRHYRAEGIDTTHVGIDPERPTGVAGIVVDDAGNNCIVVTAGANAGVSAADVRAAAAVVRASNVVVAQCETPLDATLEAFRLARAAGRQTILNPAPAVPLPDELWPLAEFCVPNETELEALTGHAATTLAEVEAAARVLLGRGTRCVLVTLGDRGVLTVTAERAVHLPAFRVTAVDSTGAGDAFIGSLAVALAEGMALAGAARQAGAAAALSVTRPGAQASFPTREEVRQFLERSEV